MEPRKQAICDALSRFIRQRPGLEFGNYGDVKAVSRRAIHHEQYQTLHGRIEMSRDIDNSQDILDVRDIIARVEEIEEKDVADRDEDETDEHATLRALLEELCGAGGDEQWQGDWYPVTLIRDSYFKDYAQELADDIGAVNAEATWPNSCIDWDQAARELQQDYSAVEYDGVIYWYR